MKEGKSNLEIIKDYLDGNRPIIQVGYSDDISLQDRKEGEEWEDSKGNKWIKKNGVKKRLSKKAKIINRKICKACNADTRWGNYLDDRVWPKTQLCYDCFIEEETRLKINGTWELHNNIRDLKNEKSVLSEYRNKFNETQKWCEENKGKPLEFMNEDGTMEKWEGDNSAEKILEDVTKDLDIINKRLDEIDGFIKKLETEYESKSKRNNKA